MRDDIYVLTEEMKVIKDSNLNWEIKFKELEEKQKKFTLLWKVKGAVDGDVLKEEMQSRWIRTNNLNEDVPNLQGKNRLQKNNYRMIKILEPIL